MGGLAHEAFHACQGIEVRQRLYEAEFAVHLAEEILARGLPEGVLLNVNVPNVPAAEIQGVRVTRTGRRIYRDVLVVREDPFGTPYYWIGGDPPTGVADRGTDFGALAAVCISVTPIHLDLTAHDCLPALQDWSLEAWR